MEEPGKFDQKNKEIEHKRNSIIKKLKYLKRYFNKGQEDLAFWITTNTSNKTIDQPAVSRLKNSNDIDDLKYLYDTICDYLTHIVNTEKMPKREKTMFTSNEKSWRGIVENFVISKVLDFNKISTEGEILEIDALGMKLGSLLAAINRLIYDKELPQVELNAIVIDPYDVGFSFRDIIEGERLEYQEFIKGGLTNWKNLNKTFQSKIGYEKCEINLRLLRPDPNFYMIRIQDSLMFSVYLRDVGSVTFYDELNRTDDEKKFNDIYNLYKQYYTNEKLSRDANWDDKIFQPIKFV